MIRFVQAIVALLFATQLFTVGASAQSERWMTLPPTPSLPVPLQAARAEVNGAAIWYATVNATADLEKLKFKYTL